MNHWMHYVRLVGKAICGRGQPLSPTKYRKGLEIHHVNPRCLGGTDDQSNLVYLSPREHYIAHHLLAHIFGGKLSNAFWMMSHGRGSVQVTSRQYTTAKAMHSKAQSERPVSEETRRKLSTALIGNTHTKGKKASEETRRRISEAQRGRKRTKGYKLSDEHKKTIRNARKVKIRPVIGTNVKTGSDILILGKTDMKENNFSQTNIIKCCKKYPSYKTTGGYSWRYASEQDLCVL